MLIRAFEIQVGRIALAGKVAQHGPVRAPRIEPDVDGVAQLPIDRRIDAEVLCLQREPAFDAALFDPLGDRFQQRRRIGMQFACFAMQEKWQRHAPVALARQRPVWAAVDHPGQARASPRRIELRIGHRLARNFAQRAAIGARQVHADKPLRRRPVDDRRVMAPAVGIAVQQLARVQQVPALLQHLDDFRIRVPDMELAEQRQRRGEFSIVADRIQDLVVGLSVALARVEVVDAVRGRRMHEAGARLECHILAQVNRRGAIVERVLEADEFQRTAGRSRERRADETVARQTRFHQILRQQQHARAGVDQRVDEIRMDVDCLVGGDRPRRRGPDRCIHRLVAEIDPAERGNQPFTIEHRKSDVDSGRRPILVFDLRLGQRRLTIEAPVDGLQAAKQQPALPHGPDRAKLIGFSLEIHRLVRMVPVAEHTQADEVGFLAFDLFGGVIAAQLPCAIRLQPLAVFHFDLVFDRQPVAIPTRRVRRVEPGHRLALDHHVLEDLVDRVPHMDVAIRIRRAIVQDEQRPAVRLGAQALVQLRVLPLPDPHGLAFGQVAAHRERRVRQIQCAFVVHVFEEK